MEEVRYLEMPVLKVTLWKDANHHESQNEQIVSSTFSVGLLALSKAPLFWILAPTAKTKTPEV
jgi:hypothetical protein